MKKRDYFLNLNQGRHLKDNLTLIGLFWVFRGEITLFAYYNYTSSLSVKRSYLYFPSFIHIKFLY